MVQYQLAVSIELAPLAIVIAWDHIHLFTPFPGGEGTEKHTIFILTLIKKKKSIRVFMILVDFLLDKI